MTNFVAGVVAGFRQALQALWRRPMNTLHPYSQTYLHLCSAANVLVTYADESDPIRVGVVRYTENFYRALPAECCAEISAWIKGTP